MPSQYAKNAKAARVDIITWALERSGRIVQEVLAAKGTPSPEFYYQTTAARPAGRRLAGLAGRGRVSAE